MLRSIVKDASITDVAGTAWHAVVNVGKPKQGDTALVIGAGAVGTLSSFPDRVDF